LREAEALKEQVDVARQKEAVLKECIQPWLKEAFAVTAKIEGQLAQMQGIYALRQGIAPDNEASKICAQWVQQTAKECVVDVSEVQRLLDELHVKTTAPTE